MYVMFVRTNVQKNKNGSVRIYLQIAENRREGSKVRQKVIATLGRLDNLLKSGQLERLAKSIAEKIEGLKVVNLSEGLFAEEALEYGPVYVLEWLWKKIGLHKILLEEFTKRVGEKRAEIEVQAIFEMVLNRLTEPESKLGTFTRWRDNYYFGDKGRADEIHLKDYYRAMDTLTASLEGIEEALYCQGRTLFGETELVFFDTTSTYFEGDKAENGKFGHSKDHRPDRKQVVISLVVNEKKIPITHKVWEGNQVDSKAFEETIRAMKERFGVKRAILIADRGCVNRKITEEMESQGIEYVVGMKMNLLDVRETLARAGRYSHVEEDLWVKEVNVKDKRYVVCYNPIEAEHDRETREEVLSKLEKTKNIKALVHNRAYRKFIKAKEVEIKEEKVKESEKYDGKWVLLTNTDMETEEVAKRYKELWKVERAFRSVKGFMKVRPIHHWKDRRIKAHIALVFLGLYSERVMENLLGEGWHWRRIKASMKSLKMVKMKVEEEDYLIRTEMKEETQALFKKLGIKTPKRITKM